VAEVIRAIGWTLAALVSLALWILLFALAGWAGCYALGGIGVLLGACLYGNGRDRP
jgi:hypothetical protein